MSRTDLTPVRGPVDVLIVDDSSLARHTLRSIVEADPAFRVQTANDPYEAVELMKTRRPGVILLDVMMPRMDGLTFLKKLMRQHPLPVLLCTNHAERGLTGLELGALEVISKPDWERREELAAWGDRLRESLRQAAGLGPAPTTAAAGASPGSGSASATSLTPISGLPPVSPAAIVSAGNATGLSPVAVAPGTDSRSGLPKVEARLSADVILPRPVPSPRAASADPIIAVGASTGGVQAITRLLQQIPADAPGIVVVQHMPPHFTAVFAQRLSADPSIALRVAEARGGETVQAGQVWIIPGHAHGVIRRAGNAYRIDLIDGPPVNRHRPSVDVLFRSVAQAAGPRGVGVLLTGMGDDGAQGLREMFDLGAHTIAQDETSCCVFGMPREAIRRGAARQVLALDRIGAAAVLAAQHSRS